MREEDGRCESEQRPLNGNVGDSLHEDHVRLPFVEGVKRDVEPRAVDEGGRESLHAGNGRTIRGLVTLVHEEDVVSIGGQRLRHAPGVGFNAAGMPRRPVGDGHSHTASSR